jgi:hypothetical protein
VSALLALTDSAVQAVKDIISSADEVAEKGGLRMVAERRGMQANFELSVVPLPAEDEEVIEEQGPASSSNRRRPPSSMTKCSTLASSRTRSPSRSQTRSRSRPRTADERLVVTKGQIRDR